jgi:hypothetical protein
MQVNFNSETTPYTFELRDYLSIPYYLNKKRSHSIYYRCKNKKTTKCSSTCKVVFSNDFLSAKIEVEGEHNHELLSGYKHLPKSSITKIDELLKFNQHEKPSVIEKKILIDNDVEQSCVPTRQQISYRKSKFVHSHYPSQDHIWNAMHSHSIMYEGSTKFIRLFSFIPFVIFMCTEASLGRLQRNNKMCFMDATHSTSSPTLLLLNILTLNDEGNGWF